MSAAPGLSSCRLPVAGRPDKRFHPPATSSCLSIHCVLPIYQQRSHVCYHLIIWNWVSSSKFICLKIHLRPFFFTPFCSRLDGLVCNAGALMNEKTLTSEGVEVTFAAHLLFGTYLLGSLAMDVSEGGINRFCLSERGREEWSVQLSLVPIHLFIAQSITCADSKQQI